MGAGAFLPPEVIPYFGLIPLGLGLWAAWQAWRGDDDDDDEARVEGKNVAVWTVAGVTFANAGTTSASMSLSSSTSGLLPWWPTALSSRCSWRSW